MMMRVEKPDAAQVKETRFNNARIAALGIEPMTLSHLRGKVGSQGLSRPERIDFYLLMLVTSGHGAHQVDFVSWPLSPGALVFVRPGQVQQWQVNEQLEAQLVLIAPSALPYRDASPPQRDLACMALEEWSTHLALPADTAEEILPGLQRLQQDFDRFDGSDLDVSMIRHGLLAELSRIAKHQPRHTSSRRDPRATYRLFVRELEAGFRQQHSLQFYAHRLGYAESTVSRACRAAEGKSAKQVIDLRIALEAQRMLAHSTASTAEIAYHLGFSESTNFVKFFRRVIGMTPSEFRGSVTADAHPKLTI